MKPARYPVPRRAFQKLGHVVRTTWQNVLAARGKSAAERQTIRSGHAARYGLESPCLPRVRQGGEKRLGIGMLGALENLEHRPVFHDLARIHDVHPLREMSDDA